MSLVLIGMKIVVMVSYLLWVVFTVWGRPRDGEQAVEETVEVAVVEVTRRKVTVRPLGQVPTWLADAKRDLSGNLVFQAESAKAACGRLRLGGLRLVIDLEAGVLSRVHTRSRIRGLIWRWGRKT